MTIRNDVQKLEPGNLIELFTLDASVIGGGIQRFQGIDDQVVVWQGNSFDPWPIKAEGFALTGEQQPTPKLSLGNINGSISALCLAYDDMVGATLTRQRTFMHYLDAVNFPGGNPTANPAEEFPREVWFVERKSGETREAVEFELSSALNFAGIKLPRRQIIANQCSFTYRGPYCNYSGPPVATILDEPTSDPLLDACSHCLRGCKMRQWPDGVLNFGGFPAAGLVRT